MEDMLQKAARSGRSFNVEDIPRLAKRPSKANTFEYLGSSFGKTVNRAGRDANKSMQGAYMHATRPSKPPTMPSTQELADSSDDEINFTSGSQASLMADDGSSPPAKSSQSAKIDDFGSRLIKDTRTRHEVLKGMSFKKNKANNTTGRSLQQGPAARASSPSKQSSKALNTVNDTCTLSSSNLQCNDSAVSEHTRIRSAASAPSDSQVENVISERPKPRPVNKAIRRSELEEIAVNGQATPKCRATQETEPGSKIVSQSGKEKTRKPVTDVNLTRQSTLARVKTIREEEGEPVARHTRSTTKDRRSTVVTSYSTPTVKKPKFNRTATELAQITVSPRTYQTFPSLSPLSVQKDARVHKSPSMPNLKSKQRSKFGQPRSPTLRPQAFPMSFGEEASGGVSDGGKAKKKSMLRPRPMKKKKIKKADSLFSGESDREDEETSRPSLQPFPMSMQMLNSIGTEDPPEPSLLRNKASNGASTKRQKKRNGGLVVQTSSDESRDDDDDDGYGWDDDLSMSSTVDPKLLCPFCDALLPAPVTPHLKKLIRNAHRKSRPDPRPSNALGRKAPSAVFITICHRHQFESEELPKADANGWPKNIDWDRLGIRVQSMRKDLEGLVSSLRFGGSASFFWNDIQQELQKKGSRAVTSVQGQFANFEKGQSGYYGELGYAIIHQTLLDLFPPTSCQLDFIEPLTPKQFVQRVLVPEVAIRLIQEDMGLNGASSLSEAIQVLQDSSKFGVAMFPDDSAEKDDMDDIDQLGVADMIAMERARKRRKEMEEEEMREQVEEMRLVEEQKKEKRSKKKGTRREKEMETEKENGSDDLQRASRPRPRPKAKIRSASQESPLPPVPTPPEDASDAFMGYDPSFPWSSLDSITGLGKEQEETRSERESPESEDVILAPDSDLVEGDGFSPFTPTYARYSLPPRLTSSPSDNVVEPASSSEDSETSSPARGRSKKRRGRGSEDEEMTPKPTKVGRVGLQGYSQSNAHPLLLARVRPCAIDESNDSGSKIWLESMIPRTLLTGDTGRIDDDHHWLLSDSDNNEE
ncbi:hypothetical protein APHAL10511_002233 [Amanita phalloides]|nr:hypothetical protein APHAL10511_002233 [Amanita phalloides]